MLHPKRICSTKEEMLRARVATFVNPYSLFLLCRAQVPLERFDKIGVDGILLKVFLDLVYKDLDIERLSFDFTSVASPMFQQAAAREQRGFILGADDESNQKFIQHISEMFPGVSLQGRSGYFDDESEQSHYLASLAASDYDFVVIGMGAVKQENVAIELAKLGFTGRVYTCGGFIHQTAMSGGAYYPAWVDRFNLRFAYRMFKEPKTIRRYLFGYPQALAFLVKNLKQFRMCENSPLPVVPSATVSSLDVAPIEPEAVTASKKSHQAVGRRHRVA